MTVFEELIKATGKRQQAESDQDYLKSLAITTTQLPDDKFLGMPKEAQQWQNDAAAAINKRLPVPEPDGFKGRSSVGTVFQGPIGRFSSKEPNIPTAPPAVKRNSRKPSGVVDAIRRAVILHPDWTNRHLLEWLHANGNPEAKLETVNVNAGDIRHTIIMARELGFWFDANYLVSPEVGGTINASPEPAQETKEQQKEEVKA